MDAEFGANHGWQEKKKAWATERKVRLIIDIASRALRRKGR
jgi:hypothetical protein